MISIGISTALIAVGASAMYLLVLVAFHRARRVPLPWFAACCAAMLAYSLTTSIVMLPDVSDTLVRWTTPIGCAAGIGFVITATRFERLRLGTHTRRVSWLELALAVCLILLLIPGAAFTGQVRNWTIFGTSHRLAVPGPVLPFVLGTILVGFFNLLRIVTFRHDTLMVCASTFLCLTALNDSLLALGLIDSAFAANFGALAFLLAVGVDESRAWGNETHSLVEDKESLRQKVLRNTSQLAETQELLERSERLAGLGRLASAVGHEINNPLTYVMVNLDLLGRPEYSAKSSELVKDALEGAQRIADIVSQLRVLSKSHQNSNSVVDVRHALQVAIKTLGPKIDGKCRLIQELQPNLFVKGNMGRLTQLLMNLLSNSIEAVAEQEGNNSVIVKSGQGGGMVEVAIEDDGPGIPTGLRSRLFEPFATGRSGGLGLGLAIVRTIAEEMQAEIEVSNRDPHGTRFVVRIPQVDPPESIVRKKPTEPRITATKKILIIDDEPSLLKSMDSLLSQFDVTTSQGGEEAFDLVRSQRFDVIFCDLIMPGVSGLDLLATGLQVDPTIHKRFIMMTGGVTETSLGDQLKASEVRILSKPFLRSKILQFINDIDHKVTVDSA